MDEISTADIEAIYLDCLCTYKSIPVKITAVSGDRIISFINLFSGKKAKALFDLKEFGSPVGRIGYVNFPGTCLYVSRRPVRRFSVGINSGNTVITHHVTDKRENLIEAIEEVKKFKHRAIGLAMMNEYPPFKEALEIAHAAQGSCAFDKQFAIAHDNTIFYRGNVVGSLPRGKKQQDIVFLKGFQFLSNHLREGYEKTLRTFANQ